jgi:hypothetical protein
MSRHVRVPFYTVAEAARLLRMGAREPAPAWW